MHVQHSSLLPPPLFLHKIISLPSSPLPSPPPSPVFPPPLPPLLLPPQKTHTLYSRLMRSTYMSRCSSPMPLITVSPVSVGTHGGGGNRQQQQQQGSDTSMASCVQSNVPPPWMPLHLHTAPPAPSFTCTGCAGVDRWQTPPQSTAPPTPTCRLTPRVAPPPPTPPHPHTPTCVIFHVEGGVLLLEALQRLLEVGQLVCALGGQRHRHDRVRHLGWDRGRGGDMLAPRCGGLSVGDCWLTHADTCTAD